MLRELSPVAGGNVCHIDGERALVMTAMFFTPFVDDPRAYGGIAAAAALARIYARGARPLCALAIAAFPEDLDARTIGSVFRGGADKCAEAGVPLVGGHTIKDAEPKYGLSITGIAPGRRVVPTDGPRAGDVLILTKPLGTGILTTARHDDSIAEHELEPAIQSMLALDASTSKAAIRYGARAMSAVRDSGLLGQVGEMLGNTLGARIDAGTVPIFPQALALAAHDAVPSGTRANLRAARAAGARFASDLPIGLRAVLCDMQTSGGLLIAMPADGVDAFLADANAAGSHAIGTITAERGIEIVWRPAKQ